MKLSQHWRCHVTMKAPKVSPNEGAISSKRRIGKHAWEPGLQRCHMIPWKLFQFTIATSLSRPHLANLYFNSPLGI
jgi:hypothetical protein